jgi:hypothetical protein
LGFSFFSLTDAARSSAAVLDGPVGDVGWVAGGDVSSPTPSPSSSSFCPTSSSDFSVSDGGE